MSFSTSSRSARDVLTGLAEGGRELLVLGDGLGELALRLEQALLERAHPLRGVLEPAAQDDDLFLQGLQLCLQIADLTLVLSEASLVLGGHARPPPDSRWPAPGARGAHPTPEDRADLRRWFRYIYPTWA